jgi:hypothetical protein
LLPGAARSGLAASLSAHRRSIAPVSSAIGQSANIVQIAKAAQLSRQTVYRIKDDPAAAETSLATWGA